MARIVKNSKGFKVIALTTIELKDITGAYGICDNCCSVTLKGYYVAVLNRWMCPICFSEWINRAKRYPEDEIYETNNFNRFCRLLNIDND